ncbi:MAG: D-alanyl-D-alanine carboxypeptidase/D-alanyl-D-alanine-endopeptidase [Nostocaceae cyanobacterium]|nr:D-alanyl-D-alanine carboxypeptidase/D-alanyl-D-alanine-endopeptidase [Nostocaceae cyanobacterium]
MSKKITISLLLLLFGSQVAFNQKVATAQNSTLTAPATASKKICPSQLTSVVDGVMNSPLFNRVTWGVLVENITDNQILYSKNAEKFFTPASNTKLLTTAAALQELGPNYRIRTSVYEDGDRILRVVGRGDPSLKDAQLADLAKQLRQKGIRQIKELIADDSYFQGDAVHPSWMWEDVQFYYGAAVNSLIVNENAAVIRMYPQTVGKPLQVRWDNLTESYRWRIINNSITVKEGERGFVVVSRDLTGPTLHVKGQLPVNSRPDITAIAVFDPIEHFTRHFRLSLAKEGISVGRVLTAKTRVNGKRELAAVESPPLSELVAETNINSNNVYAEALLKTLASKKPTEANESTTDAGLEVLKKSLTAMGVNPVSYRVVDGSGLSRKNLISPQALVQTLLGMAKSPHGKVFRASLPVGGVSGTLRRRFRNTPAAGIVQAKTGTMTGVSSLSGYVNAPNYDTVVFSIMVNQYEQSARIVRQAIDEIVVLLAQLQRC